MCIRMDDRAFPVSCYKQFLIYKHLLLLNAIFFLYLILPTVRLDQVFCNIHCGRILNLSQLYFIQLVSRIGKSCKYPPCAMIIGILSNCACPGCRNSTSPSITSLNGNPRDLIICKCPLTAALFSVRSSVLTHSYKNVSTFSRNQSNFKYICQIVISICNLQIQIKLSHDVFTQRQAACK